MTLTTIASLIGTIIAVAAFVVGAYGNIGDLSISKFFGRMQTSTMKLSLRRITTIGRLPSLAKRTFGRNSRLQLSNT
jgi:hypothetical protein